MALIACPALMKSPFASSACSRISRAVCSLICVHISLYSSDPGVKCSVSASIRLNR